jgi:N-methylhydantoinase A/oxoprolinase/acetone carboxylase beta subunit
MGHLNSGILNFPRRITTTYLNAALYAVQEQFSHALNHILDAKGLSASRYVLKPDGGTLQLDHGNVLPARTAQSGPAASVMGALALDGCKGTTLILDIGGTTTDMAVILDGVPLMNPHGIKLGVYQTLIRSLLTHSLGLGGDSEVRVGENGELRIGPQRKGGAMALGGPAATPTDAMIALGLLNVGKREAATSAMERLGKALDMTGGEAAERILTHMATTISDSVGAFLREINSRPVYTVHEVLEDTRISPTSILVLGGAAPQVSEYLAHALNLPCRVPPYHDVANAVGAAVARVTTSVTLQADTQRGKVVIPEANFEGDVGVSFGLEAAVDLGRKILLERAHLLGADEKGLETVITEKQMFHMIRGGRMTGRNIRLKLSVVPGLVPQWTGERHPQRMKS